MIILCLARNTRFQNHRYKTKRATHDKCGSELGQALYHSTHGAGEQGALGANLKPPNQQAQSNHHQVAVSAAQHAHDILAATMAAAHRSQAAAAVAALNANGSNNMVGHDVVATASHQGRHLATVSAAPMLMHDKHWPQAPY